MAATLSELLAPQVVTDLVSRLRPGAGPLASWLGWVPDRVRGTGRNVELGGPATLRGEGALRSYTYRIMDASRVVMKFRAPGTAPGTVSRQPVGQNTVTVGRFHQKIPLLYEFLGQLSKVVGPNTAIDEAGRDYVVRQEMFLAQQGHNALEMMAAGMMRDSLFFVEVGDDWWPTFLPPAQNPAPYTNGFQVPFLIPAGNTAQLNLLGTGNIIGVSWDNPAAPIYGNLLAIRAAFAQLTRYNMTDVWINSLMLGNLVTNTEIRNLAGSAAAPVQAYDEVDDPGLSEPGPANSMTMVLKAIPWVKWHVCDDTLAINTDIDPVEETATAAFTNATLTKEIPDNQAIFCHRPSPMWQKLYLGGEYVVENMGDQAALRMGWHFWHERKTQPSSLELISLLNCVPALYIPKIIAPATVVGFPGG